MTRIEALDLAIKALREKAEQYHFDQRAVDMLGASAPSPSRKGVKQRSLLLKAVSVLTGLKQEQEQENE